jgi:hypothetical protein
LRWLWWGVVVGITRIDREIGPKGYDPYCHNPYRDDDSIDLPAMRCDDSIL